MFQEISYQILGLKVTLLKNLPFYRGSFPKLEFSLKDPSSLKFLRQSLLGSHSLSKEKLDISLSDLFFCLLREFLTNKPTYSGPMVVLGFSLVKHL